MTFETIAPNDHYKENNYDYRDLGYDRSMITSTAELAGVALVDFDELVLADAERLAELVADAVNLELHHAYYGGENSNGSDARMEERGNTESQVYEWDGSKLDVVTAQDILDDFGYNYN